MEDSETTETKIVWHEWSGEAFRKAKQLKKPILMDISAVWCYWCHVMDETTYSDKEVVRLVNSNFVPMRVDTDQRPDINRRYNVGGWPTTAFLTSDGEVITGATYVPPKQMKILLRQVSDQYNRPIRGAKTRSVVKKHGQEPAPKTLAKLETESSEVIVSEVMSTVLGTFDNTYGGFGDQPKFPNTDALDLVLQQYNVAKDRGLQILIVKTLNSMASGGMYDKKRGGFFRYATRRDWSKPHYEKILEDNAKLATTYLNAYRILGIPEYKNVTDQIVGYVESTLSNKKRGGFYGSQDADEEYYQSNLSQLEKSDPPRVDPNIYVGQNALMASTYFLASAVLGRPDLREFSVRTLNFLYEQCRDKDGIMYHTYTNDGPKPPCLLLDQVLTAQSLLKAYMCLSENSYLNKAEDLTKLLIERFYDSNEGGFFDTLQDPASLGALKVRQKIIEENSNAAELLLELYDLTENELYIEKAEETLGIFEKTYRVYGIMASSYAHAAYRLAVPQTKITVVGEKTNSATTALRDEALKLCLARQSIRVLDPHDDEDKIEAQSYSMEQSPTAYICVGGVCLEPITDPEMLASKLSKGISAG